MSLRLGLAVVAACIACMACGGPTFDPHEPTTAKEKQLREARASGEVDKPDKKWAGWRYQGESKTCFFVVGRRCFRTEKAACTAACKSPKLCVSDQGAPATISCRK